MRDHCRLDLAAYAALAQSGVKYAAGEPAAQFATPVRACTLSNAQINAVMLLPLPLKMPSSPPGLHRRKAAMKTCADRWHR